MFSTERLADIFVEVADTLVDEFDLIEFLHNLADHAAAVSGVSSVGLLLADQHGDLHHVAASSASAKHLELFQIQNSEGPCFDCFQSREPIVVADLHEADELWPAFAPHAVSVGVRSVHAFPMRLRDRVIGAMNIFGEEPRPIDPTDAKLVQAMTDVATIAILQERAISSAETLTEQLQGALNSRIVIEQAKGVISRDYGVDVDTAFATLRTYARRNHLRLADLSHDVVNGTVDLRRP